MTKDLTAGKPLKSIIFFMLPIMIGNIFQQLYSMADTFFIGKISTSASGAVGIAFSVMAVIQAIGFFFGQGYGILQSLFQSFVTGTTPAPQRGVANATYMLSYDVGIGIGSLLMGCLQETIGLPMGFALTAIAYLVGGLVFLSYVDRYYRKLKNAAQ